jgi:drug/metabolite transporter (DMT)-like permease
MSVDSNLENKFQVRWQLFVAIFALIAVNALWGLSFPIIKSMNLQMEHAAGLESSQIDSSLRVAFTAGMIAMRFAVAFLLLCFLGYKLVLNASMAEWRAGAVVGLFFYFGLMLQVLGLATIPASRSGFLTSLTAVFTPLFSALVLRRIPTSNVWIGGLIALMGVSLLTGLIQLSHWQLNIASDAMSKWTTGDTLTTLGSVLFTGQLLLVDYYGKRLNTTAITPSMFLTVALAAAVTFLCLQHNQIELANGVANQQDSLRMFSDRLFFSPMFLSLFVFLAFFCSVLAFLGMNRYQPHVTAVQASVIYSTEPVFASMAALFLPSFLGSVSSSFAFPNEELSFPLVLGGALVLIANVVALWPKKSPQPFPTNQATGRS